MRILVILCLAAACDDSGTVKHSSDDVDCGGARCPTGQLCCAANFGPPSCAATCPAHTVIADCDGPGDCPGGICCKRYQYDPTSHALLSCLETGTITCVSQCVTSQPIPSPTPATASSCTGSAVDRLCASTLDCLNNGNAVNCCKSRYWPVCVDDQIKASILQNGGSCS